MPSLNEDREQNLRDAMKAAIFSFFHVRILGTLNDGGEDHPALISLENAIDALSPGFDAWGEPCSGSNGQWEAFDGASECYEAWERKHSTTTKGGN